MTHLLVTNDFPPKVGGIQAYLWELWRRLDPDSFAVLTARSHPDAAAFDRQQAEPGDPHRAGPGPGAGPHARPGPAHPGDRPSDRRRPGGPRPGLPPRPARPAPRPPLRRGAPRCRGGHPRTAPGHPPVGGPRARVTACWPSRPAAIRPPRPPCPPAGRHAAGAWRSPRGSTSTGSGRSPTTSGPRPGPISGCPPTGPLVVSVSRLVPRKGMDVLIDAAVRLRTDVPDLTVAIAGRGRDSDRLAGRVAEYSAPVRLLGGVSDAELPRLVGAADVFAMLCRNRWLGPRAGGIRHRLPRGRRGRGAPGGRASGWRRGGGGGRGDRARGPAPDRRRCRGPGHRAAARRSRTCVDRWGAASRQRAEASFDYDKLAPRLAASLADVGG